MKKNTASQKWVVYAFEDEGGTNPGNPVTGDAAQITANVRIDGGAANAVDDTNPTELEDGYYVFDITAAESNGDLISIHPASSTSNVLVVGVPGAVWTSQIGSPVALDGGSATIAGMLAKMADDNGGADFDATYHSLLAIRNYTQKGILKNTALNNIPVLMVDSSDHVTPKTGLTVSAQVSKDAGSFTSAAGSVTEIGNGMYQFDATSADMNADMIIFRFTGTGADATQITFVTSPGSA